MSNVHLNFRSVTRMTNLAKWNLISVAAFVIKFSPLKILGSDLANCKQIYIKGQFTVWCTGKKNLLLKKQSMYLVLKSQNLVCLLGPIATGITSKFMLMSTHIYLIDICKRNLTIDKEKQAVRWAHQVSNGNVNNMKARKLFLYFQCIFIFSMKPHGSENRCQWIYWKLYF